MLKSHVGVRLVAKIDRLGHPSDQVERTAGEALEIRGA